MVVVLVSSSLGSALTACLAVPKLNMQLIKLEFLTALECGSRLTERVNEKEGVFSIYDRVA